MMSASTPGFRWDRFLTLALSRPLKPFNLPAAKSAIPVLMYHSISDDAESGIAPYYRVCTRPTVFAEQMRSLANASYRGVSLEAAFQLIKEKGSLSKIAVITFDDGFRDFYTEALPILKAHEFTATMYLPTAFIGAGPLSFKSRPCLTWTEVREARAAGMEFGSHTVNHPKLYDLNFSQIREELRVSKAVIEQEVGAAVKAFAYPFAFPSADKSFVRSFTGLLQETGYESNVTTRIGRMRKNDDHFTLKRLPVNSDDDALLFSAKLNGNYDWMNGPQVFFKRLKSLVSFRKQSLAPTPMVVKLP